MFANKTIPKITLLVRSLNTSVSLYKKRENPIQRTFRILINDVANTFKGVTNKKSRNTVVTQEFPSYTDVVIIGGGGIGSSIAYWLKEHTSFDGFNVLVIEKDLTYSTCSTSLSVGGLRQQFSLTENIQMSLYGYEFLRTLKQRFGPQAEVNFTPHGYLLLASEEGAELLIANSKVQNELGANNVVLTKNEIKDRFPWMNVEDVAIGCLGLEKEGWFDAWSLLQILKKAAVEKGARYLNAEVVDFKFEAKPEVVVSGFDDQVYEQSNELVVKMPDGETRTVNFALCVVAAGPQSGQVARLLKIGNGSGILNIPLPVEPRKRYVYSYLCQDNAPGLNTPMTIDHTGAYFRRDGLGGNFIAGISPDVDEEPETTNLDVNFEFFDRKLWPILAHRVPAFNALKVCSAWSGFYEYNTYDENGIIGPHPLYGNIFFATGFSGHGIQQAPAVGRAISELILEGRFQSIDLTRLGFDRLLLDKPMYEARII
ncbi:FAD-dependent oxidoreductase domain-containing protein 1-like [Sitophilus oryzae]|uniref:FAD-dependent oxidoreductase domain-containing protein 1-like n=1 Tax=Sitophilus oryzae TaxID=7048 RepID=A0A6J2X9C2_SITOR|nr:FAD-dependent oxidoreductase domain-containing protein 1-like [Sitophilus oryzae]